MKPRNVVVWILLLGIVVLLMSTSVQAKELTEVNATDILEQIEKGEDIYLKNIRIIGELDLSEISLKTIHIARLVWEIECYGLEEELKIVESNIIILDSVIEEDVDFSNTQFRKDIDFRRTSFSSKNDFSAANFGYAYFEGANFAGDADFSNANSSRAYFGGANFAGDADFWEANFGDAYFEGANFAGNADFLGANFGYVDFSNANFAGDADFFSMEFDEVSFTRTTFTNVFLIETDFNQMDVEWSTLKDVLVFDGPTYIKIIKNFREMEQFEDADAAYYQYRRLSQANKKWSFSKLMDVVAGASCGYGVKPECPLIWAFSLIMGFTLVYWLGKGIKRLKENDGDKNRVSRWAAFYNAFYFSVVTFTTVGYGDWYPEDRYRIVVMIEGVLGWLLLALFIVTLANVMIRP